jgi:hypothetical protein
MNIVDNWSKPRYKVIMSKQIDDADFDRLVEIRQEMMALLNEAKNTLRMSVGHKSSIYQRAESYWIGHIDSALGGGDFVDTYNYTFKKTLYELEPAWEDGDDNWRDNREEAEDEEECEEELAT